MILTVKTILGKEIEIDVNQDDNIEDIISNLKEINGFEGAKSLLYKGKELDESKTLEELGIDGKIKLICNGCVSTKTKTKTNEYYKDNGFSDNSTTSFSKLDFFNHLMKSEFMEKFAKEIQDKNTKTEKPSTKEFNKNYITAATKNKKTKKKHTKNKKKHTKNKKKRPKIKKKTKRYKKKKNKDIKQGGAAIGINDFKQNIIQELKLIYILSLVGLISQNFLSQLPASIDGEDGIHSSIERVGGLLFINIPGNRVLGNFDLDAYYTISCLIMEYIEVIFRERWQRAGRPNVIVIPVNRDTYREFNRIHHGQTTLQRGETLPHGEIDSFEIYGDQQADQRTILKTRNFLKFLSDLILNCKLNQDNGGRIQGGDFIDHLLNCSQGNAQTKRILCRPLFDNKVLHGDCLAVNDRKTLFDNTILLGATRESMGLHGVGGQAQPQLIYAYAWWLWTSPFGIFKMINASNSMRIDERLAPVFHLPQLTTSIRTIISEEYDMRGTNGLWRGEVTRAGDNWLNNILNHPLWVENPNRCSNQFHTFMIHQSHVTALTDNIDVAKGFAEILPSVDDNTNTLFQIMGEVRVNDGNIEYIDDIVKTNHPGYHDISFWPREREYLLKPGIFFIRCPSDNPVEIIPQSAEESEHKIIRVYHYPLGPLGEVYELSLAIMFEFIDEYATRADFGEGDIELFKGRVATYFERESATLEIEFKNFIDPSNDQRVGVTRNWIESLIYRPEIRARFEQEYILPIFGEVENEEEEEEEVDYSGYYALATLFMAAGISVITNS